MSDQEVRAALAQMQAWMTDPTWEPEPKALIQWNAGFRTAVAQAEKTIGWPDLVTEAHHLGQELEVRVTRLVQIRDSVKAELDGLECGNRALRGYGATAR